MKRYISSAKPVKLDRRQLLREQSEFESRWKSRNEEYQAQYSRYQAAKEEWKNNLLSKINSIFSSYIKTLPGLEINTNPWYGEGITVVFNYEHATDAALKWEYKIILPDEGDLRKESSSYSGLSAVRPEDFENLTAAINFLKAIFEYDGWEKLLSEAQSTTPSYKEYVTIKDPRYDPEYKDPGYKKMVEEATLQSFVGKDIWIHSDKDQCWYNILGETPKYFKVYTIVDRYIRFCPEYVLGWLDNDNIYERSIKKEYLRYSDSMETLTTDELKEMIEEQIAEKSQ